MKWWISVGLVVILLVAAVALFDDAEDSPTAVERGGPEQNTPSNPARVQSSGDDAHARGVEEPWSLESLAVCDSTSMSAQDVAAYDAWLATTPEGQLRAKLTDDEGIASEALRIERIEDPGQRLFARSILFEHCGEMYDTPEGPTDRCLALADGRRDLPRLAFEVLFEAAQTNHFPALLKLADYEPEGMGDLTGTARRRLVTAVMEVVDPAFEKVQAQLPKAVLHPADLETIGAVALKRAGYARELDAQFDFWAAEKQAQAYLMASRVRQPTQYIPESMHCKYLDARTNQQPTQQTMEVEALAGALLRDLRFSP